MQVQYNPLAPTLATQGVSNAQGDASGNLLVTDSAKYANISTSALIKTGPGFLLGVIINSQTSGTLKLWDNTSAATTVLANTITFSAIATTGERFIPFWGARFTTGLYATTGGTVDLTIIYN